MAGIGYDRQLDHLIGQVVDALVAHTQVILNVSRAFVRGIEFGVKLTEYVLQRLPSHIG